MKPSTATKIFLHIMLWNGLGMIVYGVVLFLAGYTWQGPLLAVMGIAITYAVGRFLEGDLRGIIGVRVCVVAAGCFLVVYFPSLLEVQSFAPGALLLLALLLAYLYWVLEVWVRKELQNAA